MNFASLLRQHETRQRNVLNGNQFTVKCNRVTPNGNIKIQQNNFSGYKRKNQSHQCIRLMEIYENFQQDQNVQFILEMQTFRVKLHKFRPSKIKNTKKLQNIDNPHFNSHISPNPKQYIQQPTYQQQANQQNNFQLKNQVVSQRQRQRKNYSPMQKLRPRTFGREQNWTEQLNQNKFSFGDDSQLKSQIIECESHYREQIKTDQNQQIVYARKQYEGHSQYEVEDEKGVNLIDQFQRCSEMKGLNQNNQQHQISQGHASRKVLNQLIAFQKQKIESNAENKIKCTEQNPNSMIDFNLDVGFSFEEFEKIDKIGEICQKNNNSQIQNQKHAPKVNYNYIQQNYKSENNTIKASQNSGNAISQMQQFIVKTVQPINCTNEMKPFRQTQKKDTTSLGNIVENQINYPLQRNTFNPVQIKTPKQQQNIRYQSNVKSKAESNNQKQLSPHRIYCKANVRNLTPQKFKYPRIQSKIEITSQVKGFFCQENQKQKNTKTQENILFKKEIEKVDNQQSEKDIGSSKKLQYLIDQSNKLLAQRNKSQNKIKTVENQDRIARIVLHQPAINFKNLSNIQTKNQPVKTDQAVQSQKSLLMTSNVPDIIAKSPVSKIQKQNQKLSTPQTKQFSLSNATSPKSPIQQKPKFYNQLANMQTNYTPVKKQHQQTNNNLQTNTTNLPQITNYIRYTQTNAKPVFNNNTNKPNQNSEQKSPIQSNYAYKPMGIPQAKLPQGVQLGGYKTQFNQSAIKIQINQNNQRNIQPATIYPGQQQVHPVKTYSPYFNVGQNNNENTSNIQNNVPSYGQLIIPDGSKRQNIYQNYTYSNASFLNNQTVNVHMPPKNIQVASNTINPLNQQIYSHSNNQPLANNTNNYIKINSNYISPLENGNTLKTENRETKVVNVTKVNDIKQKQNTRPQEIVSNRFGIEGIKCVQSKIYDPSTMGNKGFFNMCLEPKESSIQFSLKIDEHFQLGK